MSKKRLDIVIVEKGLVGSREKAKAIIMSGQVYVEGKVIDKPGTGIDSNLKVEIRGDDLPYVSRGGLKLEKALKAFPLSLEHKVMADIGASTGGFTDCALKNNAAKVYAIDVGYGQLDWKLRIDPKVINMERTNARYLKLEDLGEKVDIITIDVAFISLVKILPTAVNLLKEDGNIIALIKPQFEAGKGKVGKKGVVKDIQVHIEVIEKVINSSIDLGFTVRGLTNSPIKGPEGNIEYLLWLDRSNALERIDIEAIVHQAHTSLNVKG